VLVIAAAVAGVTGAWSPCGFSMVETLAPHGYAGRLRTTLAACATFAAGALAGGVITFGGLSLLGAALGAGGPGALAVAAAVALAAAVGEARGARIVPQVRRQVPESWRRRLPVPLAAGLYGVLLGLGFTTFILTFAVWALAGACVAAGDPALGVAVGLAFGAGRLLPVVVLAPPAGTEAGAAAHAAMAERPAILRSLRAVDAVAMAACAVVLVT
jgi:cytochrome c-type biogenesis protein